MTDTYFGCTFRELEPDEPIPCAKLITADRITGSQEMNKPGKYFTVVQNVLFSAALPRQINTTILFQLML